MLLAEHIPLLIVTTFLLLIAGVALLSTKPSTTFKAYTVGNKQFSTGYLVATVLATFYGGCALVNTVKKVHSQGVLSIIYTLLDSCLGFWMISWFSLRMAPFMHHFSMAETIGKACGHYPRIVTALMNVYSSIIMVAIQIHIMAMVITTCIGSLHRGTITMLAVLILLSYATIGGIVVVTVTDIVQLGTFCMVLPLLYSWIWLKTGKSLPEVTVFLEKYEKFQFNTLFHFDTNLVTKIVKFPSILVAYITPVYIQRIYMSSDPMQASKAFRIASIVSLLIKLCIVLIGVFIFVLKPELDVAEIWPYIINAIPPIFKGFVAVSLLAAAMSTADSYLNTATVLFSHDVVDSIIRTRKITYNQQLLWAKFMALFIGILALILSFYCTDLRQLTQWYFDSFAPVSAAPFILALFGFRTASWIALTGMATGIAAILAWNQWIKPSIGASGAFPCMLMNGLTMLLVHYLYTLIKTGQKRKI